MKSQRQININPFFFCELYSSQTSVNNLINANDKKYIKQSEKLSMILKTKIIAITKIKIQIPIPIKNENENENDCNIERLKQVYYQQ